MAPILSTLLWTLSVLANAADFHQNRNMDHVHVPLEKEALSPSVTAKPNILYIMVDDLGWANVGYHNSIDQQINTPNIDYLATNGLRLNRMYVYRGCAPSRSSFQTGRMAQHVAPANDDGITTPTHGIPVAMTTVATKLKEAGYNTYLIGKWDAGFATYNHLPINKGYDYFYGYLGKAIGYFDKVAYNSCPNMEDVDLWENDHPAYPSVDALQEDLKKKSDDETYIEFTFKDKVLNIIRDHGSDNSKAPFFLMYSSHLPHFPAQVPSDYLERDIYGTDENMCQSGVDFVYPGADNGNAFECRTMLQSQVNLLDEIVGEVINEIVVNDLWEDTLIIFASDNGGHVQLDTGAGNNYPLRGGKETDFEGGIRAITFVTGGFLPETRRGQIETGYMHTADWYTTFCSIVGVDATDTSAKAAGLPPVDGLDMWPLISGEVTESPRNEILVSDTTIIIGDYKLMTGKFKFAIWQAPVWPLGTTPSQDILETTVLDCVGSRGDNPCLFNIREDESEYVNIAKLHPDIVKGMQDRFNQLKETFLVSPDLYQDSCPENFRMVVEVGTNKEEKEFPCGCWMATYNYNGFDGPYQDLPPERFFFDLETLPEMATGKAVSASASASQSAADFDHPQVDRSDEFDHPKIDHSEDNHGKLAIEKFDENHRPEEFEEHLGGLNAMDRRNKGRAYTVEVDHDLYLMAAIAVFMRLGLTTKYCIRGKGNKDSVIEMSSSPNHAYTSLP